MPSEILHSNKKLLKYFFKFSQDLQVIMADFLSIGYGRCFGHLSEEYERGDETHW